jgi:hypothetical protein
MNSKAKLDTCPTCKHFIPYQDGCQDGRCTEFMGSYGSHTTHDHTCDLYEPTINALRTKYKLSPLINHKKINEK